SEAEPERADLVRFYVNDLGEKFLHARFFQAASTSASRSGDMPARSFDCRSCGSDLNQASVSRAVSARDRKVKPLASALSIFVRAKPPSLPVQTGMSDHAETFCSSRNFSSTHVNAALDFSAALIPSNISPMPRGFSGPVAL